MHFFVMGELKRKALARRHDIYVHEIIENVHSMREPHRNAILAAMGGLTEDHLMVINSAEWTACPRVRLFYASFATPTREEDIVVFPRRESPWERGWSFHAQGRVPTFLRSRRRVPGEVRIPNYQAHPSSCLLDTNHRNRWDLMTLTEVRNRVRTILGTADYPSRYPLARPGLRWIVAGTHRHPGHEEECDQYVDWLHEEGWRHGIRPPLANERARAAGLEQYCADLGLTGRRLYDIIGLSFDGYALMRRVAPFLRGWGAPVAGRWSARPPPSHDQVYQLSLIHI